MNKVLETVIIGSGPGGYVAAIRAAQLGQKVTVIEKGDIGGTCLNVGCIPSKALLHIAHDLHKASGNKDLGITTKEVNFDFETAQKWKNNRVVKKLRLGVTGLLKKNKVEVISATATFKNATTLLLTTESGVEEATFKHCIIAAGSSPIVLPFLPKSQHILDSTGLLNIEALPKRLAIVGAGYIGSELAQAFAMMGSEITLIEGADRILPGFESDISSLVKKAFDGLGMKMHVSAKLSKVEEKPTGLHLFIEGQSEPIEVDKLMVSVGRKANTSALGLDKAGISVSKQGLIEINEVGQTSVPNIYAIGDVVAGLALAHKASYEAKIVAEVISGHKSAIDYKAMPAVCYTTPEVATSGLTLEEAKTQGYTAKATVFPSVANSRTTANGGGEGFVRLVFEEKSGLVLGAQIVGEQAGEMITVITTAIETGLTIEDLALIIFPHPSLSEAIMDNAELAMGYPIHL
ncbi:MAG: dihydrolipoyl dehydrogenase [Erysipelothrix sp.]|jgi:dihydrolipoamide dehydrogenase|nr:dihydrolipoyl dehydrogenase [Erysipelothrix sp.]